MEGKDLIQDGDLLADGYSDCIIGVAIQVIKGKPVRRVIYDAVAMIEQLAKDYIDEINPEDAALEFLEFHNFDPCLGDQTPIYLWPEDLDEDTATC